MEVGHVDIDAALKDLGQFGPFQAVYFTLLLFPNILSGFRYTEYIFTTMDIPHRCRVPECEGSSGPIEFSPPWLESAVPFTSQNSPEVCQRFRPLYNSTLGPTNCSAQMFDPNSVELCDDWVFSESAQTVAHDFNIMCPEDYWKRTFLGSISLLTGFIGLPLTGFFSDRFGRKTVLVSACVMLAVTGVIRSFSVNYAMLATMEMFDGLLIGAVYDPAFLLGMETLAPSKRVLGTMIISIYFAIGQVVLACLVWWSQDWRLMQRTFYIPMLAVVALHWLLPESVHWLYTKQRYTETEKVFQKIAKLNKTVHKLPNIIKQLKDAEQLKKDINVCKESSEEESKPNKRLRFSELVKSKVIMKRLLICFLCRGANAFTYYGLSQNSLHSGTSRYLSFLLVSLVEVPGYIASGWVPAISFLGRRGSSALTFLIVSVSCIATLLISPEHVMLTMCLSLIAKFSVTIGITTIYIYTAEVFPTELRHSMLCACGISASISIITTQQIPLVESYIDPVLVYAIVSFLGCALILTGPETLNTKLPDTIQEAEDIGKKTKSTRRNKVASFSDSPVPNPVTSSNKTIETIA